ncbi:hypothetical protein AWC00_19260 [Mycobacterium conspicuum]|nr:hypothetical protein AWC00_19260 [Mycobacterium conspicuum]
MALKSMHSNVLVILGTHCKDHSAFGEFHCVALQADKGFPQGAALAQNNPLQSVVTDDAAPDRVIEIEYQALRGKAQLCAKDARDRFAVARDRGQFDFLFASMPKRHVMPDIETVLPGAAVDCDKVRTAGVGSGLQMKIQLIEEVGSGTGQPVFVAAHQVMPDGERCLLKNGAAEGLFCQGPAFLDGRENLF